MKYFVRILCLSLILSPAMVFAFNLGDAFNYSIQITNNSSNPVFAYGKTIQPKEQDVTVTTFNSRITVSPLNYIFPMQVLTTDGTEICLVAGHVDIEVPGGFSMYAKTNNPDKCGTSNSMMGGFDNLALRITVK